MNVLDCFEQTQPLPIALFVGLGLTYMGFLIFAHKLPIGDALRVLVGVKSYRKGILGWCLIAATLAIPLAVGVTLIQDCISEAGVAVLQSE